MASKKVLVVAASAAALVVAIVLQLTGQPSAELPKEAIDRDKSDEVVLCAAGRPWNVATSIEDGELKQLHSPRLPRLLGNPIGKLFYKCVKLSASILVCSRPHCFVCLLAESSQWNCIST